MHGTMNIKKMDLSFFYVRRSVLPKFVSKTKRLVQDTLFQLASDLA
jgi:hypothetical protein